MIKIPQCEKEVCPVFKGEYPKDCDLEKCPIRNWDKNFSIEAVSFVLAEQFGLTEEQRIKALEYAKNHKDDEGREF